MTPIETAKGILGESFRNDLEAHLLTGFVFSTPYAFLMGKPVPIGARIVDPWETWARDRCDAWFCWCFCGDLREIISMIPHPLPFAGWFRQRRGWRDVHWVSSRRFESALAKCLKTS